MSQEKTVSLLVVLSAVLHVPVLSACYILGPTDCGFTDNNDCGWLLDNGWSIEVAEDLESCGILYCSYNYFLEFKHEITGRVESRTACSTNGRTRCFEFIYRFARNDVVDLSVITSSVQTGETVVWTIASSDGVDHARVPINTNQDFTVILEAKTRNGTNPYDYVRVDNLEYRWYSCHMQPSEAKPTTTTISTTTFARTSTKTTLSTSTSATPTTTTQPTTTSSFDHGRASGQTKASREVHTESTSPATTAAQAASSQSQDDVVTIVGTVAGVVVVAVVAVVLLFVLRRKQLLFFKTCFKTDKQRREHFDVTTSHNAAYNLDLGDQGEVSDMKMAAIDTEHRSPSLDATAPSQASDDYYNIVNVPHKNATPESPNQMYAVVNKPRRPNPATTNTTQQQATPLPSDQMYAAVNKPHRPDPGPQPTVTDPAEDSPYEIASDTPDCTAHQPAGDAAAGLYHCLEDDPETQPQLDTTDPYLAPDTLDTDTYTQDTDTYTLDTDTYTLAQHLYDVPPGARSTPANPTHSAQQSQQHPLMSQDEDGDYSTLNLGGRKHVEDCGEGEGPGHVYSGLNDEDGDTYSEVNHHRRREIIDDQYSRFQSA